MRDKFYQTDFYRFKYEDDIMFMTYINGPITLDIAKEIVAKRCEMMNNEDVFILIDDMNLKSIDHEARAYLSSDEGVKGLKAGALVVSSAFSKHMANFFLKITVNKQKIPTRLFTDRQEAIDWLNELKANEAE